MNDVGNYIKGLRQSKGLTQEELGSIVGVKKAAVQKWESGIVTNLKRNTIQALAEFFNVSPASFVGGDSSNINTDLYTKYPNIKPIKKVKIPMLGNIACGEPIFADEQHETYIETDGNINADFCLTCSGDSMEPKLLNGDIVFIRQQAEVNDGQIAAVIIEDEATLKRVYYDKTNNILRLIAENPKYDPLIYSGEQLDHIRILGRAVSLYRRIQ